jgi:hypothetical protein
MPKNGSREEMETEGQMALKNKKSLFSSYYFSSCFEEMEACHLLIFQ